MDRSGMFLTSGSFRLFYRDTGEGLPVVFLHGWNASHLVFEDAIKRCCGIRAIRYDARGHGYSEAPDCGSSINTMARDLNELIMGFNLRKPMLVGWSMGAAVIYRYAANYGCGNISGIVSIDMVPKVMNDDTWKLGLWQGEYGVKQYMDDMTVILNDIRGFGKHPGWVKHQLPTPPMPTDISQKASNHTLAALWHSMMADDYRKDIQGITVPTWLFFGTPGDKYSPEAAEYMAEHIKGETFLIPFENCGHDLMFQKPKETVLELNKAFEYIALKAI